MNKKFSTLLAGAAFLSAVSVNAQIKLNEGANSGLYQLKAGSEFLSITEDASGNDQIQMLPHSSANLGGTMWCVTVDAENQGQNPKYDFTNKIGKFLGLDISTIAGKAAAESSPVDAVVGGDLSGWKFSPTFKNGVVKSVIYSYFTNDSVIGLKVVGSDVKMVKVGAEKADPSVFTEFELVEAAEITISNKDDFNSIFGTQDSKAGVALTFDKDVKGEGVVNPFNAKKILLEDAGAGYFYVLNTDSSYLYVDTAYTNAIGGSKFLAYNWSNLKYDELQKSQAVAKPISAADSIGKITLDGVKNLASQFKFKFKYKPSVDSLEILVNQVYTEPGTDGYWKSATVQSTVDGYHVSLQELLKDQVRILTVAEKQNTQIKLGFAGCEAAKTTKTTVADGVYLIKNAKNNKYLASPIHNNGASAEWVTLDLQDANHMPAYQWVVLKNNVTDKNNISPVKATNREFPTVTASMQLNKAEGASYMYASALPTVSAIATTDSLEFIPVAKEIYTNKYIGYKHLTEDELITNKYTFNYWHPYADDKFIGVKDSTMNVLDGKKAFTIKSSYKEHAYGYAPTPEVAGNKKITGRIPGLVQLVRTMYIIMDGENTFRNHDRAVEDKYILSKHYPNTSADSVYFKENNDIKGIHYYAIVEATSTGTISAAQEKVGVSDYDATATLKAQVLGETRTSAFAIAPDNTPLYRHFNNAALGENTDDSTDSLIFVEKIRKEYLMDEWNENLTTEAVDYAGIWDKDKAKGKLAFTVDTAWVNRGSGLVKPQYLISVARDDQGAISVVPCTYEHNHYDNAGNKVDAAHCSHATQGREGFAYGKYLVSFADSVIAKKYKAPYMDIDGGYTRVGFVKAIKVGDSLVVLTNGFEKLEPAKLDTATIFSNYRDNKLTHFIVDLTGDNHKNVTWSFRYVNPDKAGAVTEEGEANEFLFESNIYSEPANAAVTGDAGKAAAGYDKAVLGSIAPEYAAWLKMQNGCLVLTRGDSKFADAKTGSDGALIFNAYQKTEEDDMVTSNGEVSVEGVSVVAGNGTVTVQGAAGKSVVITNILGKVVAETVLASDNATIAVPAGIVAVAVEGEEAVKAIVK
ncbi:DUF6383 domain-containing protein [Parabacteroides sp. ZJ-118]|uniref:DUF6383 domain-containing protein n=1 Tax=Parabacteroides sp. ZJ-118 TaxID=2709398 RepID=UPI0013EB5C2B|nr:DUF6383 domain-containing protein [Parabacteroides sp. ZJ-118]